MTNTGVHLRVKWALSTKPVSAKGQASHGFALATVLIASTVMLTVLLVSVQSTAAIRASLQSQYYNALSRTAAESGIAFAKACLANNTTNPGAPLWSSSNPLQVNTGCDGNVNNACNLSSNAAGCTVSSNGTVVSNFSVAYPPLDNNGDATSLTATGIVNVLRTSQLNTNTAPWRTYKLTYTVNLVTPNLCSSYNTATTGWSNVVATSNGDSVGNPNATPIGPSDGDTVIPGPTYFRNDFSITTAGTYTLAFNGDDRYEVSVDGQLMGVNKYPTGTNTSITLAVGCHTIIAKNTNYSFKLNKSSLDLYLRLNGSTTDTLVTEATDTKWRVTYGSVVDYSQIGYFDDVNGLYDTTNQTLGWSPARILGVYNGSTAWGTGPTNWTSVTGSTTAQWIAPVYTSAGLNKPYAASTAYPSSSYVSLRSSNGFSVAASTALSLALACDDSCVLYMDGQQVLSAASATTATTANVTVAAGSHEFAVLLYNGGASANSSGVIFSATRTSDSVVLDSTGSNWEAVNDWQSTIQSYKSYDKTFVPANIPAIAAPYLSVTNLIPNPSFETNVTSNILAVNSTVARSSVFAASGTYSIAVTPSSSSSSDSYFNIGKDSGNGMQLGMIAGHQYLLSATVNVPAALTGALVSTNKALSLNLCMYTSGYAAANCFTAKAPNAAGTYKLVVNATLSTDATQAYIRLYNGALSGGGAVYWDAVSLVDITTAPIPVTTYHDGTVATYPGWAWTGTSQVSTSFGPYAP